MRSSKCRRGSTALRPSWWLRVTILAMLATGMTACGTAIFSGQDVRLQTSGDTLYVFTRSDGVSRGLCSSLGGDVALAEARRAADEGRTIQLGRSVGCYTVRQIIVCSEENASCLAHEERHAQEGAFHP